MEFKSILFSCLLAPAICPAQTQPNPDSVRAQRARMIQQASEEYKHRVFTHADTLRGSITPERVWWDVQRYDITVKPDFVRKSAVGKNLITYKVVSGLQPAMQLDLQEPLHIDSVLDNKGHSLPFTKEGNAWHVQTAKQKLSSINTVEVYFSGTPHESTRPPWSGGWTFAKDSLGRPWMTVTCQGLGASIWYPCKDHQSDEPDKGASLTMIAPDTLVAVVNPISNYCIIPYIGKYTHFHEDFQGEKGHLDLDYWVLDYNLAKAKTYIPEQVHNMMHNMEHWFGPYAFYEDGYYEDVLYYW